jgi:polyisoprenoid-binding protein YceI
MRILAGLFVATSMALVAQAEAYLIDPVHSAAVFRVGHMGVSYTYGLVPNLNGELSFDAENPEKNSISVEAQVSDLTTEYHDRDQHLKNEDFFHLEQFPLMRFESTSWKKTGEKTYEVTGKLTLLAVTKEITIPVEHVGSAEGREGELRSGFDTKFTIKRSDYGMDKMIPGAGDEVTLMVGIEAIREGNAAPE